MPIGVFPSPFFIDINKTKSEGYSKACNLFLCLNYALSDNTLRQEDVSSGLALPLLLILGYTNGFQVWTMPVSINSWLWAINECNKYRSPL